MFDKKKRESKLKCPKCKSKEVSKVFEGFSVNWKCGGNTRSG